MKNTILNKSPFIGVIDSVLSVDECKNVISSMPEFNPSMVHDTNLNSGVLSDWRTSETSYTEGTEFDWIRDKVVNSIKECFNYEYNIFGIESIQFQKYGPSNYYKEHVDFFTDDNHIEHNDRIATAILYLNSDFKGGTTDFMVYRYRVHPKPGRVLFFDYSEDNPTIKHNTLHRGSPVIEGEKLICTYWFRKDNL